MNDNIHLLTLMINTGIVCAAGQSCDLKLFCVFLQVGVFGYIAFYDDDITGDVLMNFNPTLFSEIIKIGFVISTVISFPLVIFPCRASIYTLLFAQVGFNV